MGTGLLLFASPPVERTVAERTTGCCAMLAAQYAVMVAVA